MPDFHFLIYFHEAIILINKTIVHLQQIKNMGNLFKTSLSFFGLFFVGIIVIGFFLPKENRFTASRVLQASQERIFPLINETKNWEKWSPWVEYDPNMQLTYSEPSAGAGAWYSWKGNGKVGYGKLSIQSSTPNASIETILNYEDQESALGGFKLSAVDNGTKVEWYIDLGDLNQGIGNRFFGGYKYLLMKHFLGKDFGKGLENLDNISQ